MDNAGAMAKSLDRVEEAADLLEKASQLYALNSNADMAVDALKRAGEMVIETNADRGVELYLRACDTVETENRMATSGDTFKATYGILLRNKRCVFRRCERPAEPSHVPPTPDAGRRERRWCAVVRARSPGTWTPSSS